MRKLLNKALQPWGYQIAKLSKHLSVPGVYEPLREAPRYTEQTVQLCDRDFRIADAASFYYSHKEIFGDHIYKFKTNSKQPIILDCGANCGVSAIYFKELYPDAHLTCVEADPNIFEILKSNLNLRHYKNLELVNRAISTSEGTITFQQEGADAGRSKPASPSENLIEIPTIQLDDLIHGPVDFLKMDIEGSETEVICSSKKLDNVCQLFIEYHSFKDSPQTLSELLEKLSDCGFRYYIHTQFCSPRPLTKESLQLDMDLQLNIFAKRW